MNININLVIGLGGIVMAIFGQAWLTNWQFSNFLSPRKANLVRRADYIIEPIDYLKKQFDDRVNQLEKSMDNSFAVMETRVGKIERQLEQIFKPVLPR